jgi:hypothetical protein
MVPMKAWAAKYTKGPIRMHRAILKISDVLKARADILMKCRIA